jgi:hypothetical protein
MGAGGSANRGSANRGGASRGGGRRPGSQGPDHPLIVGGIGHARTNVGRRSRRRQTARVAAPLAVPVALGVTLGIILAVSSGPTTAHVNQGTTGTTGVMRPTAPGTSKLTPAPSPTTAPGMVSRVLPSPTPS